VVSREIPKSAISSWSVNNGWSEGGVSMAIYIMFGKYSQDSIRKISAKRTDKAIDLIKKNGGEPITGYALLGEIDLVAIVDFPNVEQAMKTSVAMSKMLGISFTTAPAVTMEDFDRIIEDI
jgi:uncharacterized protein with GYD domain